MLLARYRRIHYQTVPENRRIRTFSSQLPSFEPFVVLFLHISYRLKSGVSETLRLSGTDETVGRTGKAGKRGRLKGVLALTLSDSPSLKRLTLPRALISMDSDSDLWSLEFIGTQFKYQIEILFFKICGPLIEERTLSLKFAQRRTSAFQNHATSKICHLAQFLIPSSEFDGKFLSLEYVLGKVVILEHSEDKVKDRRDHPLRASWIFMVVENILGSSVRSMSTRKFTVGQ